MILALSSSFSWLEFVIRHPGLLLVLLGVAGEVICDWKEMEGRLARAKRISAILLVVGLAIEFIEAANSDREVAALGKQAATAIERAGIAEQKAGEANERAAITESNNLVLRSNVVALEQQMANSDRSKWPVYSVTAEVGLRFNSEQELAGELKFPARLTISRSRIPSTKILLASDNAINTAEGWTKQPTKQPAGKTYLSAFLLQFSKPFRPLSAPVAIPIPLFGRESATVVADELDTISLQITNFPAGNADVTFGTATIAINEIILKRFNFNPGTINNGFGILTGFTNGASGVRLLQPK